jgi:hypothetical protein
MLLFSNNGEGLCLIVTAMVGYSNIIGCILLVLFFFKKRGISPGSITHATIGFLQDMKSKTTGKSHQPANKGTTALTIDCKLHNPSYSQQITSFLL